jgi:hypothetical protein
MKPAAASEMPANGDSVEINQAKEKPGEKSPP